MRLYGLPRFSMDWDLFVPPRDSANFQKLNELLDSELDAEVEPLGSRGEHFVQTFQTKWGIVQFHLLVPGVPKFELAEAASVQRLTEKGTPVKCLSGRDLLLSKEAANRPEDQLDIEFLRELQRSGRLR